MSHFTVAGCHVTVHTTAETVNLSQLFDMDAHSSLIQQKGARMLLSMRQPNNPDSILQNVICKELGVALVSLTVKYFFRIFV